MKTSKLNFLIPILAILFAVTSAFTVSTSTDAEDMTVYINTPEPCTEISEQVNCAPQGNQACTYQGLNVFDKLTPTICSKPLYRP